MSALFPQDFSILEEIEWGHFIPPTASDLTWTVFSLLEGSLQASDSLPVGEMKPLAISLPLSACGVRHCLRAAHLES